MLNKAIGPVLMLVLGICVSPAPGWAEEKPPEVIDLEKIGEHPHFAAVGLLQDNEHPTEGPYRYARDPIKVDGEVSPLRHHAPRLGADTEEVMRELGWDDERIAALRPAGTS